MHNNRETVIIETDSYKSKICIICKKTECTLDGSVTRKKGLLYRYSLCSISHIDDFGYCAIEVFRLKVKENLGLICGEDFEALKHQSLTSPEYLQFLAMTERAKAAFDKGLFPVS